MKYAVLSISLLMYLLVIIKQDWKVIFTTVSAVLVIAIGCLRPLEALGLINFNVLMIYLGSMIIASLFIYSKVPSRIADFFVDKSPSSSVAIIAILAMTGIISIFVENVATVLVMAPIALSLSKKLKITPVWFLSGLAVMSNLEGTATLVGDPPSMIFASFAGFTFNDFFIYDHKLSIFFFVQSGLIAGCVFFWFYFRKVTQKTLVEKTQVISFIPAILLIMMIVGLAAVSFTHISWPYISGTLVMALAVIALTWYKVLQHKKFSDVAALIKDLDWETIFFLCGIFVVVGAISKTGLLDDLSQFLSQVARGSKPLGFVLILLVSIIISGFVDNVPYIIVMLPVAALMSRSIGASGNLYMFALLIGSCLGGNLTPFGASANIAAIGILKKEGYSTGFGSWLKIGVPFTVVTTAVAAALLYAVWG